MAFINWGEQLSVKIQEFDFQHKKLIACINDLHTAMSVGKGKEVLDKVISDLLEYTKYHFGCEERLMTKHGYPEYAVHKKEHDDLTNQVLNIHEKFRKGQTMISLEVMTFLKGWLNNHILGIDKKYSPFFSVKKVA